MTAKEHLQSAFVLMRRIKRLNDKRESIRADLYSIGSPSLNDDKVQTSPNGDRMADLVASVDEIERDIVEELKTLTKAKDQISREIEQVQNENYRQLLFERYILCERWEKIALDRNIGVRWIYRMHGKALSEFEKVWIDH